MGLEFDVDLFAIRREFHLAKRKAYILVEDCIGDGAKLETICKRVKATRHTITALAESLFCPDLKPMEMRT